MNDVAPVKVGDTEEYLAERREEGLGGDAAVAEGTAIHVLELDLELPAALVHVVVAEDWRVLGGAKDGDLVAYGVEHLELVKATRRPVPHHPHRAAHAAPHTAHTL